jgi:type I restriction enzyme S subunit
MTASSRHLSSTIKTLTDEGLKHSNAWVVPANSILYSIYATLGLPRINTVPVATNQAILALINYPNKIDRDYLYYWFEYIRASVVNFSSQTTQSNLNATTVKTFLVDHPTDLSEQTKIAEVLSTVDLAIEQTETLIAKQQRIKTGLMQDLLTRGIDEHGNLRSEQTHEFKDSPLGRIPVEWEVGGFDNYVINDAGIKPGPFGSSLTKDMYVQEGCRVYGQEQVIGGTLDIGDYFIPKRKFTEMAGFAVRVGDVLISLVGTIGHVLIVPNDHHPGLINPRLLRFRPDTRHCLPEFLRVLLLSQPIRLQLDTFATGGTMPVLSAGIIRKLCVVVIKADEQARIIQTISKSEECIFSASESLNKLRSLKTGLMQDLLTGKKRVTALLEASL